MDARRYIKMFLICFGCGYLIFDVFTIGVCLSMLSPYSVIFEWRTQDYTVRGNIYALTWTPHSNSTVLEIVEYPSTFKIIQCGYFLRNIGVLLQCCLHGIFISMKGLSSLTNNRCYITIAFVISFIGEIVFVVANGAFVQGVLFKVGAKMADATLVYHLAFFSFVIHYCVLSCGLSLYSYRYWTRTKVYAALPVLSTNVFRYQMGSNDTESSIERADVTEQSVSVHTQCNSRTDGVRALVQELWDGKNVGIGNDARGLTHRMIEIISVEEIRNQSVMNKYMKRRNKIMKRSETCGPLISYMEGSQPVSTTHIIETVNACGCLDSEVDSSINEAYLFHGTTEENAQKIRAEGFKVTKCQRQFCGRGVYFAESPVKADQYTGGGDVHVMILSRVLLGNSVLITLMQFAPQPLCPVCLKKYCMNIFHMRKDAFDSVVYDKPNGLFREFVVFEDCLVYPEYIITY